MNQASPQLSESSRRSLASIVGEQQVRTSFPDRLAYQNDCWPRGIILSRGRRLNHHLPSAIVQPESEEEVVEIVRWAAGEGVAVVPFGAGSGVCAGAVADSESIVVDLKRLDDLIEIDADNRTVRAGPGIIGMDLETYLNDAGWTMGHYPSSLYCSSLGGYLAARSAGQYSSRYGKIEDMVLSMRAVTGDGEVVETAADVGRHSAEWRGDPGRDLNEIVVGNEGTLGLITEALMRIEPKPTRRNYRGFQFSSLDRALDAIRQIMQRGLRPTTVRLYDEVDSLVGGSEKKGESPSKKVPNLFERLAGRARKWIPESVDSSFRETVERATQALTGRAVGQPLVLNSIADILPGHSLLVVGFEGTTSLVDEDAEYAYELCRHHGIDLGKGPGEHWLENRFSVSYKQSPMFDSGAFVDTMEVSTTWDNLRNLYDNVREAMRSHVFVMAHFSHVYPEGSSIYFTFAGFGADVDESLRRYQNAWQAGLDAVADSGASIAHHHGVGKSKAPWTGRDHRGGKKLFDRLKDRYDPHRILNPGAVYPDGST